MTKLTQEQYDAILEENPNLWKNYSLQAKISKEQSGYIPSVNNLNKRIQVFIDNGGLEALKNTK